MHMNKKLLFLVLIVLAITIILIVGIVMINIISNSDKLAPNIDTNDERPNIILKVKSLMNQDLDKEYTLSKEESSFLYDLVENMDYRNYTCDGIADYEFTVNNNDYGIEVSVNELHIVLYNNNNEAVIIGDNYDTLKRIINKYLQNWIA